MDTTDLADRLEYALDEFYANEAASAYADTLAARIYEVVHELRTANTTPEVHCGRTKPHSGHLWIFNLRTSRCPGTDYSF